MFVYLYNHIRFTLSHPEPHSPNLTTIPVDSALVHYTMLMPHQIIS